MRKADTLRTALEISIKEFKDNPDKLLMFIEDGQIVGTGAQSSSFEYRYWLNIIVTDFAEPLDKLVVPIMQFIRRNQPELLENPQLRESSIIFASEQLNHETADYSIRIKLTESVVVSEEGDKIKITHISEPSANAVIYG